MSKKELKKSEDLALLYRDLNSYKQKEDYDKALKTCHKILEIDHTETLAFQCKIVCLLQASKFQDALKQIDQEDKKHNVDFSFEIAYCYYRLNKLEKSLEVIDAVKSPALKHQELKAQILYKLEEYESCFGLYRNIVKNTTDDFEVERRTNISAVVSQLADDSNINRDECDESYELRYNCACALAAVGDFTEAQEQLITAEKQAEDFLKEEGETEEDIEEEIGIIKVQLAYVLQMQGKEKEAQTIYNNVLKNKPADIGLIAVASNNLLTLNRDQNIFDSKKRVKAATADGLNLKLNSRQRNQIARNQALLAMFTAQVDLCKQLVDQLDSDVIPDKHLIIAGVLAKSGKYTEAVKELEGDDSATGIMTAAQILLTAGEVEAGLARLESLPDSWKYRHGVLSALVSLYLALEDRPSAASILKKATEWNLKNKTSDSSAMNVVWQKTAEFHMSSGEPEVAARSLEEMLKVNSDLRTLAQLVLAYAKFDLKKALEAAKKLPPFDEDMLSSDIAALEESAFAMGKSLKKNPLTPKMTKTPKTNEEGVVKKKTKKRKKRLPKNYDPNATPDPERWLPRRERTGLKFLMPGQKKIRKDRRKNEKFTGAQGTDAGKTETFDYSDKVQAGKVAAKTTSPQPESALPAGPGPRQQKRSAASKPKKKGNKNRF